MTTEKEAKMLKCPTTRTDKNAYAGEPCIGSACMRWRWESQQEHRTGEDRRGYCGSGGKP